MTAVLTITEGCTSVIEWPLIVRQHGPIVWKTAYRLLGQDADAADCFQETFVSAIEYADRQEVTNWPGLLQRLATARALDHLRRRIRAARRRAPGISFEQVAASGPSPDQAALDAELGDRLRAALCELAPRQSAVFCLRCLSGLSYEEIASELGLSIDAVGVTLHRARARLQELLGGSTGRES
ncbi:MAG TPA: sigma-70 family RNA polymerase sigma factor [Phycisphaerae bacterium]|nr:sigma-70 family RNA polymerase sigma factor [Phycisphaerae bacterium]HRY66389.1 sigma-70 family RNA polymerase sigma factor [Phycisphaerae bacterium]HSA25904.1 sigma-70 family RNA polymerase sigma factor [Phycisphaerae bacterium]